MSGIYLDHNATTPLHPRVREALGEAWDEFGNPSSQHAAGRRASRLCEQGRERMAELVNAADPAEICWTGSGSEANNLALQGCVLALSRQQPRGARRIVASRVEHSSVLEPLVALARDGVEVSLVPVDRTGTVELDALEAELRRPADLVSVMLANNEVGTVQPIAEVSRLAHAAGALVHVDAIQAVGKIEVDVRALGVDLLSASSHKMNGPKGVGALYVRRGVRLERLVHGGGQEAGRRAGTENTWGIHAAGVAAVVASESGAAERERLERLRERLWAGIATRCEGAERLGAGAPCLPGTLAVAFEQVHGEPLLLRLDLEGIAVSVGSACHSGSTRISHVLQAMGIPPAAARGFVRFSLGLGNTEEQIDEVLGVLPKIVEELRALAPARRRREAPDARRA